MLRRRGLNCRRLISGARHATVPVARQRQIGTLSLEQFRELAKDVSISKTRAHLIDCGSFDSIPGSVQLPVPPTLKDVRRPRTVIGPGAFQKITTYLRLPSPSENRPVICYDQGDVGSTAAARVSWVLQYYGYSGASVLDGGWSEYVRSGEGVATSDGTDSLPLSPSPSGGLQLRRGVLATAEDIIASLNPSLPRSEGEEQQQWKSLQLLDVRSPAEFDGSDTSKGNRRTGRIPGAKNLPHALLFDASGRLKSKEEIREMLAKIGIVDDPERPVVSICQAGIRASLAFVALQKAGFQHVKNYDGSMGEWLNDYDEDDGAVVVKGDD